MAYNDTTYPLIVEETSSSDSHYELMTLIQAISAGFGLAKDKPYLEQIQDDIHAIRLLIEETFSLTEEMRKEAERILALQEQSAAEYLNELDNEIDTHPFTAMPTGTTVRDLPDGGRLFSLSDGSFLRVLADGGLVSISDDGAATKLTAASGGKVILPGGAQLTLVSDAIKVTHTAAGISGLPDGVEPVLASWGRYRVSLPDGTVIEVYQSSKIAAVINPSGTIDILCISHVEGIGEDIETHTISDGAKRFEASESGHSGMIESGGTIHLSLASGLDLVITFPDGSGSSDDDDNDNGAVCFDCVVP